MYTVFPLDEKEMTYQFNCVCRYIDGILSVNLDFVITMNLDPIFYDKGDDSNFHIMNSSLLSINISYKLVYVIVMLQFLRYSSSYSAKVCLFKGHRDFNKFTNRSVVDTWISLTIKSPSQIQNDTLKD